MGTAKKETRPAKESKARRGMPLGRTKGYTRSSVDRDAMLKTKPSHTALHGIIAQVPSLYLIIDDRLEELDWNWVTLAKEIPCSRQYLVDLTNHEVIPYDTFLRICAVLTIDPQSVIEPLDD